MWSAKCSATLITTAAVSQADRTATACSESVHCQVSSLEVPKEESRKTLSRNSFHTAELRWRFCSFGAKTISKQKPKSADAAAATFPAPPVRRMICGAVKRQRTGRGEGQKCLKGAWRPCPHADRRDFPFFMTVWPAPSTFNGKCTHWCDEVCLDTVNVWDGMRCAFVTKLSVPLKRETHRKQCPFTKRCGGTTVPSPPPVHNVCLRRLSRTEFGIYWLLSNERAQRCENVTVYQMTCDL